LCDDGDVVEERIGATKPLLERAASERHDMQTPTCVTPLEQGRNRSQPQLNRNRTADLPTKVPNRALTGTARIALVHISNDRCTPRPGPEPNLQSASRFLQFVY